MILIYLRPQKAVRLRYSITRSHKNVMREKKKLFFVSLILCFAIPLSSQSSDSSADMINSWTQELATIIQAQEALAKEERPQAQGWLTYIPKAVLATDQEVRKLILESRRSMIEFKLGLAKDERYVLQLIQALTWLFYIMSVAVIIFVGVYVKKNWN